VEVQSGQSAAVWQGALAAYAIRAQLIPLIYWGRWVSWRPSTRPRVGGLDEIRWLATGAAQQQNRLDGIDVDSVFIAGGTKSSQWRNMFFAVLV
jgi:hypothetical protein